MKAKAASHINENANEAILWQPSPDPSPTFTPRERLHQNIQRLRTLERQLSGDWRPQPDLLTSIELIGFKIRHLARQMQEAEQSRTIAPISGNTPYSVTPVC
jgi:hypothetical protein